MSETQLHVDGLTGQVFNTEEEYLAHVSPVTGYTPRDLAHQGLAGLLVAEAALKRTGSLTSEMQQELDTIKENGSLEIVDAGIAEVKAGRGPDLS